MMIFAILELSVVSVLRNVLLSGKKLELRVDSFGKKQSFSQREIPSLH